MLPGAARSGSDGAWDRTARGLVRLGREACVVGLCRQPQPDDVPYLGAPPERVAKWRARLPVGKPLVGLVWRNSVGQVFARQPALQRGRPHNAFACLRQLERLARVPGVRFVSLQKPLLPDDPEALAALGIIDPMPRVSRQMTSRHCCNERREGAR